MSDFLNYTAGLHVLDKMGSQGRTIDQQNKALQEKNEELDSATQRAGSAEAGERFYRRRAQEAELELDNFKKLLSKPMHEIAAKDGRFRETYEKQQEMLADWIVSQRAFKEMAMKYGALAGKTPEEINAEGMATKETILDGQSKFGNNINEETKVAVKRKKAREIKAKTASAA